MNIDSVGVNRNQVPAIALAPFLLLTFGLAWGLASYVGWAKSSQITLHKQQKIHIAHHFGKTGGYPQFNHSVAKVGLKG